MEKSLILKTRLIAISLLYFPVIAFYSVYLSIHGNWNSSMVLKVNNWPVIASEIPNLSLVGFTVAMIMGLCNFRRWAYYMLLVFSALTLVSMSISYVSNFAEVGLNLRIFISLAYVVFITWYFLRQDVVKVFLEKPLVQDISENRWSLGLMLICWVLILLGTLFFLKHTVHGFEFKLRELAFGWIYWLIYIISSIGLLLRKEVIRKASLGLFGFSIFLAVLMSNSPTQNLSFIFQYIFLVFFLTRPKVIALFK